MKIYKILKMNKKTCHQDAVRMFLFCSIKYDAEKLPVGNARPAERRSDGKNKMRNYAWPV